MAIAFFSKVYNRPAVAQNLSRYGTPTSSNYLDVSTKPTQFFNNLNCQMIYDWLVCSSKLDKMYVSQYYKR